MLLERSKINNEESPVTAIRFGRTLQKVNSLIVTVVSNNNLELVSLTIQRTFDFATT